VKIFRKSTHKTTYVQCSEVAYRKPHVCCVPVTSHSYLLVCVQSEVNIKRPSCAHRYIYYIYMAAHILVKFAATSLCHITELYPLRLPTILAAADVVHQMLEAMPVAIEIAAGTLPLRSP
jgi:hypothetical protein